MRADTALGEFEIVQVGGQQVAEENGDAPPPPATGEAEAATADEQAAGNAAAVHTRSVRVLLTPDEDADLGWVASSRVHTKVGITLVRIGDLSTETALLDPVARSLAHFMRMLLGHDFFKVFYIRTEDELRAMWSQEGSGTTHLLLLAHGSETSIRLLGEAADGFEQWMNGGQLAMLLGEAAPSLLHVISLCCETGYAGFSQPVSNSTAVRSCAAPLHSVHGAIASQFAQTLFIEHFLQGRTWPIAFRHARASTPGTSTFRLWVDGTLAQGTTT